MRYNVLTLLSFIAINYEVYVAVIPGFPMPEEVPLLREIV